MGGFIVFPENKEYIEINSIPFSITKEEQSFGLMGERKKTFMIFLYKENQYSKFWMKNTPKPLDIIFINNNWEIDAIEKGIPFNKKIINPNVFGRCVIEAPYGFCKNNSINLKDKIKLKYDKVILEKILNSWS
jgi:uncharacterized membrane protein (UPF0127 family)